ncbi:hypothetical protein [Paracoccus aestuariivivens]|uniref:Porin n=1 Tax=Paracoccus aestuariivivens TaxID=1820333 RepID=A0A6L6JGE3_9RHOB|nr:hypothetical protein [Paracoccus aestuariivivens]MTH79789.1 hypothetical protein [Paracoccus aestuariivivens]
MTGTKGKSGGRRICDPRHLIAAAAIAITAPTVGDAQDLRYALDAGMADLALFTLSRTERKVSPMGQALLGRQGFRHGGDGRRFQPIASGHALTPVVRHDNNVNDGIPSDHITLGGLRFRIAEEDQAKSSILAGLQYSRWWSFSYAPAARVTVASSYTFELEPHYGYHHVAANARICAEQPVADWTWWDSCLTGIYDNDSIGEDLTLAATTGPRALFESPFGMHQLAVSLGQSATKDYRKSLAQLSLATLSHDHGLFRLGLLAGEKIEKENSVLYAADTGWTGEIFGRDVTVGIGHARTGGADLFGIAREDRINRASVSTPVGKFEIGGFVERRRSTIDAYNETSFGLTMNIGVNLFDGLR